MTDELDELSPATPLSRAARCRTGGFASPSFDGYAFGGALANECFLSNEAELNAAIMFLQLSVETDIRRVISTAM